MIFEAEWVVPISSAPLREGAVLVRGEDIVEVGAAKDLRERHPNEPVRSFHHSVLLPGFVNVHSHLELSVFRGLFDDCDFGDWMIHFMSVRDRLDRSEFLPSALLGALECVGSGITCIADTVTRGHATIEAASAAGLRTFAFLEAFGMDDTKIGEVVNDLDARLASLRELAGPLITLGISPHAPYTVSGPLYRALIAYANSHGLKVATHLAESQDEVTFVRNGAGILAHDFRELTGWDDLEWMPTGTSPVKYLEQWGVFDSDLIAIHCVHVSPSAVEVLARYDVAVAHCPKSNAKLGCGVAPVADFLAAGMRVGLGTDSLASNNILDMFDEMRTAIFLMRASRAEASCMSAEQILRMATLGGAQVLGIDRLAGTLEPGKKADMIAVDTEYSHFAPIDDPVSALVYGANQEDVFFTMVNGRVIYDRKVFQGIDAAQVTREASKIRAKLLG